MPLLLRDPLRAQYRGGLRRRLYQGACCSLSCVQCSIASRRVSDPVGYYLDPTREKPGSGSDPRKKNTDPNPDPTLFSPNTSDLLHFSFDI